MANRVFFSFHYQDVIDFRANVVRNHWLTKPDRQEAGFFDASLWEDAKKKGDISIKRLIHSGIDGTSVTCVLIGTDTYSRRWVRYEIMRSLKKGNGIFGVHINSIKGRDGRTKAVGPNPLEYLGIGFTSTGLTATLYEWTDKWREYSDVDGSASYQTDGVAQSLKGKTFRLSELFNTYDWVSHDGYNKFSSWVG